MEAQRYPEMHMPIAGEQTAENDQLIEEFEVDPVKIQQYRRFCDLREDFLLGYGYNTARAYWGDLDDILLWALDRDKDPLALTDKDIRQYVGLLRRRKYSENTVRRRLNTLGAFYRSEGALPAAP